MSVLYTLGYSVKGAMGTLQQYSEFVPRVLFVDTRHVPYSSVEYFKQFNKEELQKRFPRHYQHIPELGNVNHNKGGPILLADEEKGMQKLLELLKHNKVLLICGCKSYEKCHRYTIALKALEQSEGLIVRHITEQGIVQETMHNGLLMLVLPEASTLRPTGKQEGLW